jgi:hypothetical protein
LPVANSQFLPVTLGTLKIGIRLFRRQDVAVAAFLFFLGVGVVFPVTALFTPLGVGIGLGLGLLVGRYALRVIAIGLARNTPGLLRGG